MGGLWWWIHARSVREVRETFAEVEVVVAPDSLAQAEDWRLAEVDIDAPVMPAGLDELRVQRDRQRALPGFGALADREIVYLRQEWDDDDPATYLLEIGADGRRVRQVERTGNGTATRTDTGDWLFNPPVVDLFDPLLADREIDRGEFERWWSTARWEDDHRES
ncbi:hypothetical protein [Micromonospora echinofusca]|uniref:Uncharacterized protein n=1 Tax=Micromonospora echinofusca TaxID=47858 RepID=A0ABS3VZ84_MICEH|nr:hypothetical protein [Micromonospora echinofusca]